MRTASGPPRHAYGRLEATARSRLRGLEG
jgi:hypothetical protein